MNKKIIISTAILFLLTANSALAAAPTPTPTSASLNSQINQLKDKIANQVSKLNLVEKRGIIGTIQSVNNNQLTLTDTQGQMRYVDVDEITKFSSVSNSSFGLSDLKKGMLISVLGIYNKESQRILGRYIDSQISPTRFAGEITAIDGKNFVLTIMTIDQKSVKVEIDTTSAVSSYSGDATLSRYGFSKLTVGDRVEVVGYPDKKDNTLLIADRMIDLLTAPKNQNIQIVTPTTKATVAPTSPGAKSIKPIK